MDYKQTIKYLFSFLPMYQRIGIAAYKANLDNTIALCKLLGNPENKFRSIHVGGTNGKGSVSHMIASVLQCSGYKVGLYTSPHLKDFRERIRINGKMIPKISVVDFVKNYKKDFEKIQPSFFEMTVALAFNYFEEQKVDIAIIEVGLGGRLDSTNVITPFLSVVTNISLDHTNLLGNTKQKIAEEKAGIIKKNGVTLIGEKQIETDKILKRHAKEKKTELFFAEDLFEIKKTKQISTDNKLFLNFDIKNKKQGAIFSDVQCDLSGLYQKKNILTVVSALELLTNKTEFKVSESMLRKGLHQVSKRTGLKGRWQLISTKPLVIADTGHNEDGIKEVTKQIRLTPFNKLHFVFGSVKDKDVDKILKLLPKKATYYFCKPNIDRGLDENILAEQAKKFMLKGKSYPSVMSAFNQAKSMAQKDDFIFIGGSTFVVAEVI